MATNYSILCLENSWAEHPGGLQPMEFHKSWAQLSDEHFHFHFSIGIRNKRKT